MKDAMRQVKSLQRVPVSDGSMGRSRQAGTIMLLGQANDWYVHRDRVAVDPGLRIVFYMLGLALGSEVARQSDSNQVSWSAAHCGADTTPPLVLRQMLESSARQYQGCRVAVQDRAC